METVDLLSKVRKIEIKTKKITNHLFTGQYNSAFKGKGMTFWYWTTHYQIEYFENVLPHYIENIRSILREKLNLNFSDYLHKYHSHMIYEEEQKMSDFPYNEEVENVTQ